MRALKIIYKDPNLLKPRAKNPRTHTSKQIQQIATSIKEFGFINPILIDGSDGIIAGHGRVVAAKSIGMTDVPTVRVARWCITRSLTTALVPRAEQSSLLHGVDVRHEIIQSLSSANIDAHLQKLIELRCRSAFDCHRQKRVSADGF